MRYPATEKLEVIRLVEQSHLPAKRTLAQLGIPKTTFYCWYDLYITHGPDGHEDSKGGNTRVWNRIADEVRSQIIDMALEHTDLSPRELAVRFCDEKKLFFSDLPRK
jgi:transposase-like protein